MRKDEVIGLQIERIVHKYTALEKKKRYFGTNIQLTCSEIHTIDAIGSNDKINITQLAALKGVTKGAVSQMIYKLIKKGLVKKTVSPKSDTEVILELTESGQKAYDAHLEYHRITNRIMYERLEQMKPENYERLKKGLQAFEDTLDKFIDYDYGKDGEGLNNE
ncbi:MAG: winged helix-turn-helix transcriptional regulator [Clostridium butyricum]|nr:winged helix-turn-helix transcriptional regulator [Clostridium butyricum]